MNTAVVQAQHHQERGAGTTTVTTNDDDREQDRQGHRVDLGELFGRERLDHQRDHDREHLVSKETAQRLARELDETAQRVEGQVDKALKAVAETATIHSEAHSREHAAHERIHAVEKDQLEKAEIVRRREAEVLADQLKEFKATSNEWRGALNDQSARMWTRTQGETLQKQVDTLLAWQISVISNQEGMQSGRTQSRASRGDIYAAVGAIATVIVIINVMILLFTQ